MPVIESHIKKYIDSSVDEARKGFRTDLREHTDEIKRHTSAFIEHVDEKFRAVLEVVEARSTENRVREIICEEIQPLETKMDLCIAEVGKINRRVDNRERRITKLESATA